MTVLAAIFSLCVALVGPIGMTAAKAETGQTVLTVDHVLRGASNDQITSPNHEYRLVMQSDGNLVLYGPNQVLWATATNGGSDRWLVMQGDGNLVLYNGAGSPLWSTQTGGSSDAGASLQLQNDGNLVVYRSGGRASWATSTTATSLPGDGVLTGSGDQYLQSPNRQYRLVMQGDGNLVLYGPNQVLWATATNGGSDRWLTMQGDGNLVVYNGAGSPLWSTGTGGQPGAAARLQDDGRLVVFRRDGSQLWSSGTTGPAPAPVTSREQLAAGWAAGQVGRTYDDWGRVTSGWCARWSVGAYAQKNAGYTTAWNMWNGFRSLGLTHTGNAPAGTFVFFSATSGNGNAGHVAISDGAGGMYTTSSTTVQHRPLSYAGAPYVGWSYAPTGWTR